MADDKAEREKAEHRAVLERKLVATRRELEHHRRGVEHAEKVIAALEAELS